VWVRPEGQDDDDLYTRPPRSAVRWQPEFEEVYNEGNTHVYAGQVVIPKKRKSAQQTYLPEGGRAYPRQEIYRDDPDEMIPERPSKRRRPKIRPNALVWLGLGMIVMILLWIGFSNLSNWWQMHQELTFYNGQFQSVFVPEGTTLTGSDGTKVATDADATIPEASPPIFGEATVSAHASSAGAAGNIPALDINQTCCAASVLVKNTDAFQGGQDERNFQTVTKSDISNAADQVKATVTQGVTVALQGQLKQGEQLQTLPCSLAITPDHQVGAEATSVKVTVSEACSAIAYNAKALTSSVTKLLTSQAAKKAGSGYSLLESPSITITNATPGRQVTLSFTAQGTFVYGISPKQQRLIKAIIAGKSTQQAVQRLYSLPGIAGATLRFSGFGDATRLPENSRYIHISIVVM